VKYADDYLGGLDGHPIDLTPARTRRRRIGDGVRHEFVQDKVVAVVVGQVSNTDLYIPILRAPASWIAATGTGQQELASDLSFDIGGGLIVSWPPRGKRPRKRPQALWPSASTSRVHRPVHVR